VGAGVRAQGHPTGVDGDFGPLTKAAVEAFQSSRGNQITIDGIFGPVTDNTVRAFQALLGLSVDGIVGPQTWNHLVNGYLAAPDPVTAAKEVFSAWEANNRDQAGKNATPAAVNEIFAQSFSPADGWLFEGSTGAAGTIFSTWQRSNGGLLRIGVINAVEGPYYAADQAQFT
jgi:Putative peptidoglycan binding domain